MTNYDEIDFSPIQALTEGEVITHSRVRDITLPSGKVLALITLDNGRDHTRPNTLGPATMTALGERSGLADGESPASRSRSASCDATHSLTFGRSPRASTTLADVVQSVAQGMPALRAASAPPIA